MAQTPAFDAKLLKPASKPDKVQDGKTTARDHLVAQIDTQQALFTFPLALGQRHYDVDDDTVTFWLRYGGKSLILLPNETRVSVPKDAFLPALQHYRAEALRGSFDDQLEVNGDASAARRAKAKATRDAKKAAG